MIYGIDFGSTNTVVAWQENGSLKLLDWGHGPLLPTEISSIINLKRSIAKEQNNHLMKVLCNFFIFIKQKIGQQENIDCVLSVPARFNDFARNAIKFAAIKAGFNVLKLLAEPIAAAIYALKDNPKNGEYLVYDLGGGTFDMTLLNLQNSVFQVLAIDGLEDFGGYDIDKIIAEKIGVSQEEARKIKESQDIEIPEVASEIEAALQKTYDIALKLKSISKNLNGLILVGGGAKLTCIKKFLSQHFEILINDSDNMDKMVALGAACFANFQDQLLIDIAPFNLGIETVNDEMDVFIQSNTPLPYSSKHFFKKIPGHALLLNILQGFSNKASECVSLAKFEIQSECDGEFSLTFILDYDAILTLKLQLPGQEEQILTVADKIFSLNQKNEDQVLAMLNKIKDLELNENQQKIHDMLAQAYETGCSEEALQWLKNEFSKNF